MPRALVVFGPLAVSRDFIDYPYFADLGAVQVAAVLREDGWDVSLVDAFALPGSALRPHGDDVLLGAPLGEVLAALPGAFDAAVVALTPFHRPPSRSPELGAVLARLRELAPEAPVVLADLYQSGQHVVDAPPAEVLAAYPEACVYLRHEAEAALPGLLRSLLRTIATDGKPGEARVERGTDVPHLDELPLPAWDLVALPHLFRFQQSVVSELGRGAWAFPLRHGTLPVLTSRGCPFRCVHCSSNPSARDDGVLVRPKVQRRLSRGRLAALLDRSVAHGARAVQLLDELVNVNLGHWEAVLAELTARGLPFEVPNGMRADYVRREHLRAMKGRVTTLSVSAESGVQRVVDSLVGKQLDLGEIERVAREASEEGVRLLVHFLIGLPGETAEDVNGTLEFAARLFDEHGAEPSVQFATPLPGTPLAAEARERARVLPLVTDWGPLFQQRPSMDTPALRRDELARFKRTFDLRMEASRGPKKVILNATYKCNNRCTFCATGTRTQLDGDFQRQRELLVKYRKLGVRLLDIDGGEPTLHPQLLGLVGFARRIGYERVNVTTNGRMASYEGFARELLASGVTSVLVSVHGPDAQTHAQNVGVAEAFDQTMAGLQNLIRLSEHVRTPSGAKVELGVNVTITKSNHDKLRELALLVRSMGVDWLNLQFLTPFGRATKWVAPDTTAAAERVMRLIDEVNTALDGRPPMKVQVINLPFCFMPGYEEHLLGDLLKLERLMLFVNVEEVNLFEYLRERRVKKEVCRSCPHAVFCGGFFELDDAPEPPWLVRAEDLVRRVKDEVPGVGRRATAT